MPSHGCRFLPPKPAHMTQPVAKNIGRLCSVLLLATGLIAMPAGPALAAPSDAEWEITTESEAALRRGLDWLVRNQGPEGNWESNDLGLVGMGALAFLSAGHTPGVGRYGQACERALNYVLKNAKPS